MGDDRRFVVASRGVVHREHRAVFNVYVGRGVVRFRVRRAPRRFWTRDRRYYWDVCAWVEIAPANDGRN